MQTLLGDVQGVQGSCGMIGFLVMGKQWGREHALCRREPREENTQLKGTVAPGAQLHPSDRGRGHVWGWGGGRGCKISVCLFRICLGTLCSLERPRLGIREEDRLPLHLALTPEALHRAEPSRKIRRRFLP